MEKFVGTLGFKSVKIMSPQAHDEIISFTSQLPHAIAVALINSDNEKYLLVTIREVFFYGGKQNEDMVMGKGASTLYVHRHPLFYWKGGNSCRMKSMRKW